MVSFSITNIRKKGILSRVFLSFLSLSLAFLMLFMFAGIFILNDHYQEQSSLSTQDMLDKAQIASTIALQQTMDSVQQLTQNESIISAIAVPDIQNGPRSINIVNYLQFVLRQNRYIDTIYLYSNFDNAVYSSSGSVGLLPTFFFQDVITAHQSTRPTEYSPAVSRDHYEFFVYGDQVFLTYAFPINAPHENATLYVRLNKTALTDILNLRTGESGQHIQIYSPNNEPILNADTTVSSALLDQATEHPSAFPHQDGQIFLCSSSVTGLKYVYHQESLASHIPVRKYAIFLLPLIPIILLCSVFVAMNLTEYLYKPIRKMMGAISASTYDKSPDNETELDYLADALSDLVVRNDDLTRAIRAIQPEITQKLYHSLITGDLQDLDTTGEFLPLSKDIPFSVLAVQATDEQYAPLNHLETTLFLLSVKQLLHTYPANGFSLHMVEADDHTLAVALVFPEATPQSVIQLEGRNLVQFLQKHHDDFSFRLFVALSHAQSGLTNLHTSFLEACQLINYQKYVQDSCASHTETSPSTSYRNYILSQLRQIQLFVQDNEYEQAEQQINLLLENVFLQFRENQESLSQIRMYCGEFIDRLIGQLPDVGWTNDSPVDRIQIEQNLLSCPDASALQRYTQELYCHFLQILIQNQSKQQNKYISSAKEYIHAHYTDCMLSLDTVAQQIGIHPTYLSRLFKATMNINFVEYLNKLRIEKAKSLLATTRMTVKDIGFEVGFSSAQNYLRVFKRYENLTPTQYRTSLSNTSSPTN